MIFAFIYVFYSHNTIKNLFRFLGSYLNYFPFQSLIYLSLHLKLNCFVSAVKLLNDLCILYPFYSTSTMSYDKNTLLVITHNI